MEKIQTKLQVTETSVITGTSLVFSIIYRECVEFRLVAKNKKDDN